jgi:hypothetical protein
VLVLGSNNNNTRIATSSVLACEDVANFTKEVVSQEGKSWAIRQDPHAEVRVQLDNVVLVVPFFDRNFRRVNQALAISLQETNGPKLSTTGVLPLMAQRVLPKASLHLR